MVYMDMHAFRHDGVSDKGFATKSLDRRESAFSISNG